MVSASFMMVLLGAAAVPPETVERYAVVVGHNGTADGSRADLRYADDDAARFFELLSRDAAAAWLLTTLDTESQQTFSGLVDAARPPSRSNLVDVFETIQAKTAAARQRGVRTEVGFVYAGHGDVADGEGYVNLLDGRLTHGDFQELFLEGIRADRKHVIVDACRSYFLVSSRGPGGSRVPVYEAYAGPQRFPGVGFVLSTSNDAESHEWSQFAGGVFSHEVRSALVGGADLDEDGSVDYEELATFVAVANEGIPQARYRPKFYVRPPEGDHRAVLFTPGDVQAGRRLGIDAEATGRITIVDGRGLPYADLNKASGEALSVVLLSPEVYTIRWGERRLRADTSRSGSLSPTQLSSLPQADVEPSTARAEPHEAFQYLFARPVSQDVLRGVRLGMESAPAVVQVDEKPRRKWPPWLVGGGVFLAAGGAGLIAGGASLRSDLGDPSLSQADRVDRANTSDALVASGIITAGVGVALSAVGIWFWADQD